MKEFIQGLAREAGELSLTYLGKTTRSFKGYKNVVTEADVAVERLIISKIKEAYPDHNIVAEESVNEKSGSDFTWYIDPIDGTTNYSHRDMHFAVSIALAEKGIVRYACIYMPRFKEMFFAEKGKGSFLNSKKITVSETDKIEDMLVQLGISSKLEAIDDSLKIVKHFTLKADKIRDVGFCAGQLCMVAEGSSDALVKRNQHPWDVAAGKLIVEEAGGIVTDDFGNKIELSNDKNARYTIVATNKILHDRFLEEYNSVGIDKDKLWW